MPVIEVNHQIPSTMGSGDFSSVIIPTVEVAQSTNVDLLISRITQPRKKAMEQLNASFITEIQKPFQQNLMENSMQMISDQICIKAPSLEPDLQFHLNNGHSSIYNTKINDLIQHTALSTSLKLPTLKPIIFRPYLGHNTHGVWESRGMATLPTDKIILTRPLHELWAHIRHCKLPRFALVIQAIKTLVLGIFRGHLCDHVLLFTSVDSKLKIIHGLQKETAVETQEEIDKAFTFMLEKAIYVKLPNHVRPAITLENFNKLPMSDREMSLESIREFYLTKCSFQIAPETSTDQKLRISDLFKSTVLTIGCCLYDSD